MKLSTFGEKFAGHSGIVDLMDDLGTALNENPNMIFMGGGNPARIPHLESVFQQCLEVILNDPPQRHSLLGIYQSPQGEKQFRVELARFLNQQFGWPLSERNIALSNGSQSAFFMLFNMLAGVMPDGSHRSIHLPLAPEYIGYGDTGLSKGLFSATRPTIEHLDNRLFKYHVDFANLQLSDNTAALCVSRPTNPTGNVLTDDEINHLSDLAKTHNIPLIIDGAYGLPFPNILFCEAKPHWDNNTILSLSLSKLGLPGARTGIVIANQETIRAYTHANTITSLACGNLGPAIAKQLLVNDQMLELSNQYIKPFYQQRSQLCCQWLHAALAGLPYHIHKPEGAIFLWLWIEGLPITSQELYQRLKSRGVLVVPGENFFVGVDDDWAHKHECIRVSYAQAEDAVKSGISIIADEIKKAYNGS